MIHSGDLSSSKEDDFEEIFTPMKRIGGFFLQKELSKILRGLSPAIVVGMFDLRWLNIVLLLLRKNPFKYLTWGHRYSSSMLGNQLRNYLMKRADANVLYGDEELGEIVNAGIEREKLFIAPNTIEVPNFYNCSGHKKSSFLYVGRAQERKRVDRLLVAFAKCGHYLPQGTTIDIVGEGEVNKSLGQLAKELGVEKSVSFHGKVTDPTRLRHFFERAYCYVSPGDVGLGVLHSLAYGVPVVTRELGEHGPEFFNLTNEVNACIYQQDEELPDILVKLATDLNYSTELGNNAFNYYKNNRQMKSMVKGFDKAFNSVFQ